MVAGDQEPGNANLGAETCRACMLEFELADRHRLLIERLSSLRRNKEEGEKGYSFRTKPCLGFPILQPCSNHTFQENWSGEDSMLLVKWSFSRYSTTPPRAKRSLCFGGPKEV